MTDRELLTEALGLREVARAGWKRVGVGTPESVADHSFGVALATLVLAPPELDRLKLVTMALLHDLAEVRVGDITPHDGIPRDEKKRREATAAAALFADHPALLASWREMEAGVSAEARFVKSLDLLDLELMAARYAARGVDTSELARSAGRFPWPSPD
jgi:putative hydrolase of HD superfamily